MAHPSPQLSHPSSELSPPLSPTPSLQPLDLTPPTQNMSPLSSPIPSLPSLDLTPPTQNTSESDISNNFSDPNYNNMDDDYSIPFERPPSRPMVNYRNDRELEEDYKIGWECREHEYRASNCTLHGFWQCLLDPLKTKPEDFFNALFDNNMYLKMAEETNKYAHRKKETRKYKKLLFLHLKWIFSDNLMTQLLLMWYLG